MKEPSKLTTRLLYGCCLISLAGVLALADHVSVVSKADPKKSAATLKARALAILDVIGGSEEVSDSSQRLAYDGLRLEPQAQAGTQEAWPKLGERRPTALTFWYRQTSVGGLAEPEAARPSAIVPGNVTLGLDSDGRLIHLLQVPLDAEGALAKRDETDSTPGLRLEPDWQWLLREAGVDPGTVRQAEPSGELPVAAGRRRAWEGEPSDWVEPIRIEAATLAGQFVYFDVAAVTKPGAVAVTSLLQRVAEHAWLVILLLAGGLGALRLLGTPPRASPVARDLLIGAAAGCLASFAWVAASASGLHLDASPALRLLFHGDPQVLLGWFESITGLLSAVVVAVLLGLALGLAAGVENRGLLPRWLGETLLLGLCVSVGWWLASEILGGGLVLAAFQGFGSWCLLKRCTWRALVPWFAVQLLLLLGPLTRDLSAWYGFHTAFTLFAVLMFVLTMAQLSQPRLSEPQLDASSLATGKSRQPR